MKTFVTITTVLSCVVTLLMDLSHTFAQNKPWTEGLTEEERCAPDLTQEEIPAVVETNYFYSDTGTCPPGYDTEIIEGEPPEIVRSRPPGSPKRAICTESVETIMAREAARFRDHPPVPSQHRAWSFMSGDPTTGPQSPSSPQTSDTPPLPKGLVAGAACPPGFEAIPGGAEKYGLKPFNLPGFAPVPIYVCRQRGARADE